ncbi:MAG: PAS domain S-box protein [Candidatus Eisenbacteria bacterium]|nr:PAS domain S-box protein [Candidatus Eisenbacteria bacterium]
MTRRLRNRDGAEGGRDFASLPPELLDGLEEAVWIASADAPEQLVYVSPLFEELFGVPCEDPFGNHPGWLDAIHADDRPVAAQALQDFHAGRDSVAVECRRDGAADANRWLRIRAFRAGPDRAHLVGAARNVTARRGAERALRKNVEEYAALMERSLQGVLIVERVETPRILFANPAVAELLGRRVEELLAAPPGTLFDMVHPNDKEWVREHFQARAGGRAVANANEFRVVRKDDSVRWASTFVWPIDFFGNAAYQVAAIDITERKKAEAEMRRLQMLAERSNFGIAEADLDGYLTYVNPYMAAVHGYRSEDLVGRHLRVFHCEDQHAEVDRLLEVLRETGAFESTEVLHCKKDGACFPMLMNGAALPDEQGCAFRLATTAIDIRDRKEAEEDLRRHRDRLEKIVHERTTSLRDTNRRLQQEIGVRKDAQERIRRLNERLEQRVLERTAELEKACEELKELDRMKDAFVSSVSHELRTPLTSIRSFSEFLLQNEEDSETRQHFLEIIHTETERLASLVDHVLELSQIESGTAGWCDEPFSVGLVLRESVRAREEECRGRSIAIDLKLEENLPTTVADIQRIRQVVDNLLDNAIKFSPDGGTIAVHAAPFQSRRSSEPESWLKVSIADRGPGIDPKHHEAIFDRFFQIMSNVLTDKPRGSGLGLPICRKIISRYGGNVWVESGPGEGSTFTFTLPGPREGAPPKETPAEEARAESEAREVPSIPDL